MARPSRIVRASGFSAYISLPERAPIIAGIECHWSGNANKRASMSLRSITSRKSMYILQSLLPYFSSTEICPRIPTKEGTHPSDSGGFLFGFGRSRGGPPRGGVRVRLTRSGRQTTSAVSAPSAASRWPGPTWRCRPGRAPGSASWRPSRSPHPRRRRGSRQPAGSRPGCR